MTTMSLGPGTTAAPERSAADASQEPLADHPLPGGLTLPVLALAALVCSPAIWQCLVRHALPLHVMLERYVVVALGCLLVSEAARRLLRPPADEAPAGGDPDRAAAAAEVAPPAPA